MRIFFFFWSGATLHGEGEFGGRNRKERIIGREKKKKMVFLAIFVLHLEWETRACAFEKRFGIYVVGVCGFFRY